MELEQFLKKWAKKTGKSMKEMRELWKKQKELAAKSGITDERIVRIQLARKLRRLLTGGGGREPGYFFGFILGCDRLVDLIELKKRRALNKWAEDPEEAKLLGLVDENGVPLDDRPTIKNRRGEEVPNPNYHKPLTGHLFTRSVFGIAKRENDPKPRLFRMKLWRAAAEKFRYKPFVPVRFLALVQQETPYFELTPSRHTKFTVVDEEIDIEQWMRTALADRFYSFDKLEEAVQSCQNATDPWIMIEGDVDLIDTNINPKTGSRSILLADSESDYTWPIRVFLPQDFPLGFREYSRVLVFGRPRIWTRTEADEPRFSIEGYSVYPIIQPEGEVKEARPAEAEEAEEFIVEWEE